MDDEELELELEQALKKWDPKFKSKSKIASVKTISKSSISNEKDKNDEKGMKEDKPKAKVIIAEKIKSKDVEVKKSEVPIVAAVSTAPLSTFTAPTAVASSKTLDPIPSAKINKIEAEVKAKEVKVTEKSVPLPSAKISTTPSAATSTTTSTPIKTTTAPVEKKIDIDSSKKTPSAKSNILKKNASKLNSSIGSSSSSSSSKKNEKNEKVPTVTAKKTKKILTPSKSSSSSTKKNVDADEKSAKSSKKPSSKSSKKK